MGALVAFLIAMTKYLTRNNFRKVGRYIWLTVGGHRPPWHRSHDGRSTGQLVMLHPQSGNREITANTRLTFLFFILSRTLIHEILLSTFKVYIVP